MSIPESGSPDLDTFIEKTRVFWSKRAGREFTTEEAEEMSERMYEFTSILVQWDTQDKLIKKLAKQLVLLGRRKNLSSVQ